MQLAMLIAHAQVIADLYCREPQPSDCGGHTEQVDLARYELLCSARRS